MAIASTVLSKFEDVGFHLTTTSSLVPGPEALGCMVGHTIGSGSYGEVKAAWSSCDRKLVSFHLIIALQRYFGDLKRKEGAQERKGLSN